ncbi:MAG: hypothetical protein QOD77_1492 [Thermoplasmata archaeon]|jgi:hypothetical protein|nr:hypothetical protein [Thermoplasmata archaeon]
MGSAGLWAWRGLLLAAAGLAAVAIVHGEAEASHFRGGALEWYKVPDELPVVGPQELARIGFTGEVAFRATYYSPAVVGAKLLNTGGTPEVASITWGDSTPASNAEMLVLSVDSTLDVVQVRFVAPGTTDDLVHDFPAPTAVSGYLTNTSYIVYWTSSARLSGMAGHINNPDDAWRLETSVTLLTPNHSPVAKLVPIQMCTGVAVCRFRIVAADPDGDAIRFREATSLEAIGAAGWISPGPPFSTFAAVLDPNTGWVTWDLAGLTRAAGAYTYYSMQVMVEDGETKTPVDFFIRIARANVAPRPALELEDLGGCGVYDVRFKDLSLIGTAAPAGTTIAAWYWDFGDASTDNVPAGVHAYPGPGTYNVTLLVTDSNGEPGTTWKKITLPDRPCPIPPVVSTDVPPEAEPPGDDVAPDPEGWDADRDSDGVQDRLDNCPGVTNAGQDDRDHDGGGDECDADLDGDGVGNDDDACPGLPDAGQEDLDRDGRGDACDGDWDGDGRPNVADLCPRDALCAGEAAEGADGGFRSATPLGGDRAKLGDPADVRRAAGELLPLLAMCALVVLGGAGALAASRRRRDR